MMRIKISIPYSAALLKNRMWRHGKGRTYLNPATKKEIEAIGIEIKSKGVAWEKRKIWVCIKVYRPDMRADPCNFIDAILDGVKVGTGVDDRYYSGLWDWELDKDNPRIEITVDQREAR